MWTEAATAADVWWRQLLQQTTYLCLGTEDAEHCDAVPVPGNREWCNLPGGNRAPTLEAGSVAEGGVLKAVELAVRSSSRPTRGEMAITMRKMVPSKVGRVEVERPVAEEDWRR